jgi:hypothetical protein
LEGIKVMKPYTEDATEYCGQKLLELQEEEDPVS